MLANLKQSWKKIMEFMIVNLLIFMKKNKLDKITTYIDNKIPLIHRTGGSNDTYYRKYLSIS